MKIQSLHAISFVFTFCLFISIGAAGQIIITQSNVPATGTDILSYTDTSTVSFMPQNASASFQTWNFSGLQKTEQNDNLFVQPSSTPYAASFHDANIADSLVYAPGYYYYFSSPAAYVEVGFVTSLYGITAGINLHPSITQLPFPATYGTIDGGTSRGDTAGAISSISGIDSGKVMVTTHYADTIDAFGLMTTPYGTDSVIRQKHYEQDIDSVLIHVVSGPWTLYEVKLDTTWQYKWFSNKIASTFVVMQMDNLNNKVVNTTWYDGVSILGINELTGNGSLHIYPNPCKSEITFASSDISSKYVTAYDISGRELSTTEIKNGLAVLNTETYPAGMYFYAISSATKDNLYRGKFIVEK